MDSNQDRRIQAAFDGFMEHSMWYELAFMTPSEFAALPADIYGIPTIYAIDEKTGGLLLFPKIDPKGSTTVKFGWSKI